ncbi:MAG TPA: hypothetical protein PKH94_03390 [Bacteroidales bacterium]|nr:hypothetical protein [Bacteroidales bacterium]HNS46259.1 hypothetical protein [Bacteroidales bacterium]
METTYTDTQLHISRRFTYLTFAMMGIGLITLAAGFLVNPVKTWANYLMNNYYFLSLAIGATFFAALQYITHTGWSSGFIRVPHAIGNVIPAIAVLMLPILIVGMPDLYHWAHDQAASHDPVIAHKAPYLNIPFFVLRSVIYFVVWILLTRLLKRLSLREDQEGGRASFQKSEFYSKVYIFVLAVTFSLATFDWIMSIDVHWYSTIFAFRNFAMAFYHGTAVIVLIIIILNKSGYFPFLTRAHLSDFSKYIFILSTIWAYLWFCQYMLIWYANIPEETVYYLPRTKGEFQAFFYLELIINWAVPFALLLSNYLVSHKNTLLAICVIIILGQWIDLYQQVIVGTYGKLEIGWIEVGMYVGFAGLFTYLVGRSLSKAPLVPRHHPYLEECLQHH